MAGNSFFLSAKAVLSQKRMEKMKKYSLLLLLILCLSGCRKSTQVTLTGTIGGLKNDTIYLYGSDGTYDRIDTIYTKAGKFSQKIKPDTVTSAILLLNKQIEYPIFFDRGDEILIEGSIGKPTSLKITGNKANEEYTAFQESIKGLLKPSEKVLEQKAEDFIRQHHSSLVNLYLIDKYFVQKEKPDFAKIKQLIEIMPGTLQDNPSITRLTEYITEAERSDIGKFAPFFSLPNAKGEKISRSAEQFKNKYLLINFWASWADSIANADANTQLRKIYRTYKGNKEFAMLGISLDIDKATWKSTIKRDSLNWEQLYSSDGLSSELAKQFAIGKLPTTVLLSPEGKIVAKNVQIGDIKQQLNSNKNQPNNK